MIRYAARRLLTALATLAGVLVAVFLVLSAAPGDPAVLALRGPRGRTVAASPAALAAYRAAYGLDRPLPVRFAAWAGRAVRLDFGRSFRDGQPVTEKVAASLPVTLAVNGAALALALLAGVPAGLVAAGRPGSRLDRGLALLADVLFSTPSFAAGLLLLLLFAVELRWVPVFADPASPFPGLVLPVVTLALVSLAPVLQVVRTAVRDELLSPCATADRARGISRPRARTRALRRSAAPLLGLVASLVPQLVAGSVLVERLFGVGGTGELLSGAVLARDVPTVLALTFLSGLAVTAASAGADVAAAWLDPRLVREGGPEGLP